MNLISPPHGWKEIPEEAFEAYLKTCADYRRTGYSGAVRYTFRHDAKDFAVVMQNGASERIFVDPKLLTQ